MSMFFSSGFLIINFLLSLSFFFLRRMLSILRSFATDTGNYFSVFVIPANNSGTATIGGTCGLVKYYLHGVRFVWNSALEAADSIVDGQG